MRLLRFLISRVFWVQLGLAVVLGLVGFVALNVGLRGFTRHSERIAVPAVVGLDRTGAAVALEAAAPPADLSAEQVARLKEVESRLGVVIVAYDQA